MFDHCVSLRAKTTTEYGLPGPELTLLESLLVTAGPSLQISVNSAHENVWLHWLQPPISTHATRNLAVPGRLPHASPALSPTVRVRATILFCVFTRLSDCVRVCARPPARPCVCGGEGGGCVRACVRASACAYDPLSLCACVCARPCVRARVCRRNEPPTVSETPTGPPADVENPARSRLSRAKAAPARSPVIYA